GVGSGGAGGCRRKVVITPEGSPWASAFGEKVEESSSATAIVRPRMFWTPIPRRCVLAESLRQIRIRISHEKPRKRRSVLDFHRVVRNRLRRNFLPQMRRLCRNRNNVTLGEVVRLPAFDFGSALLIRAGLLDAHHSPAGHECRLALNDDE